MNKIILAIALSGVSLLACSNEDIDRYKSQFGEHKNAMTRVLVHIGVSVYPVYIGGANSEPYKAYISSADEVFQQADLDWLASSNIYPKRGSYAATVSTDGDVRVTLSVPFDNMRAEDAIFEVSGLLTRNPESYFILSVNQKDLTNLHQVREAIIQSRLDTHNL